MTICRCELWVSKHEEALIPHLLTHIPTHITQAVYYYTSINVGAGQHARGHPPGMPIVLYEALAFVIPFDVVSLCMLYLMRFGLLWFCGIERPLLDAKTDASSPSQDPAEAEVLDSLRPTAQPDS